MRNINKTSGSPRLVALMAGAALLGLVSQSAMAVCTPGVNCTASGDTISNTATVGYSIGGVSQTAITSTAATFLVDAKINLTVAGGANTNVLPNATAQVSTFTVTNNANSTLDFGLAVTTPGTVDFTPTACNAYAEEGTTAGYQSAVDTATFIDELPADSTRAVYVVCSIPAGLANGNVADVGLVATARGNFTGANGIYVGAAGLGAALVETAGANSANVDLVFADDVLGGNVDDTADTGNGAGIRNAAASNRNTYTVNIVLPIITKTAVLQCDPLNGLIANNPKNIPGAITQWTITVTNPAGNPDAVTLTTITDALTVAKTAMDPGVGTTALTAALNVPADAATCVAGTGNYGFKVTVPVARNLGGSAGGASATTSYFTTTTTADGIDFATPTITATFATILPVDAVNVHATAGLLKPGESVTIIFNTVLQ